MQLLETNESLKSCWRWKEIAYKGTWINLRVEFSRARREVKAIVVSLTCWRKTHFNLERCNQWSHLSVTRTEQGQNQHRIKTFSDRQKLCPSTDSQLQLTGTITYKIGWNELKNNNEPQNQTNWKQRKNRKHQ